MTDDTLSTLVRGHVTAHEPPFGLDAGTVVQAGRSRVRRRRVAAGAAALAVVTVAGAALAVGGGLPRTVGPARSTYDGTQMPAHIEAAVRSAVPGAVSLPKPSIVGKDGGNFDMPAHLYGKATGFLSTYRLGADHTLEVDLFHSGVAAQDARPTYCSTMLEQGAVSCRTTTDPHGWTVQTRVTAQLRHATAWRDVPADSQPAARLWFERRVETIRTGSLVTLVMERVKAPSLAAAEASWTIPVSGLRQIATDRGLTFERPPKDPVNGCDWVVPEHRGQIGCSDRGSTPFERSPS